MIQNLNRLREELLFNAFVSYFSPTRIIRSRDHSDYIYKPIEDIIQNNFVYFAEFIF
jgi:hypothetical protein